MHFSHLLHATFHALLKTGPDFGLFWSKSPERAQARRIASRSVVKYLPFRGVQHPERPQNRDFRKSRAKCRFSAILEQNCGELATVCTNFIHFCVQKSIHRPAYKIDLYLPSLMEKDPRGSGENRVLANFAATPLHRSVSPRKKRSRNSARDRHATTPHRPNTTVHRSHLKVTLKA